MASVAAMRRSFYGWWIAVSTFISLFVMVGLIYYGVPIFFKELIREFHWSKLALTTPYAISALLIGPVAGLLIDRYGTRRAMLFGVVAAALAFLGFSRMHTLGAWFAFYFINTVGYMFAGPIPNQVLISQWFRRMRGRVMGAAYLGLGFGGALSPLLFPFAIARLGWRNTFFYGAFVIAALLLPVAIWIVKEKPADLGQYPDGYPAPATSTPARPAITLASAMGQRSFWLLAVGCFFSVGAIGAVIQHQAFLFTKWQMFALMLSSIFGRVVMGFLADRFSNKPVMIASFLLVGGSIPILYLSQVSGAGYLFAILFGFGMGADYMMTPLMAAECFGVNSLGRVMGVILPTASVGQAVFPMVVGWLYDRAGNYSAAFAVMTAAGLLGVLAISLIRPGLTTEHTENTEKDKSWTHNSRG